MSHARQASSPRSISGRPGRSAGAQQARQFRGPSRGDESTRSWTLPDPFVSGRPPLQQVSSTPVAPPRSDIIDLTEASPTGRATNLQEIIEIEDVSNERGRTARQVPSSRRTVSSAENDENLALLAVDQLFAPRRAFDASGAELTEDDWTGQRARRREWLVGTADVRARQRRDQELEQRRDEQTRRLYHSHFQRNLHLHAQNFIAHGIVPPVPPFEEYLVGGNARHSFVPVQTGHTQRHNDYPIHLLQTLMPNIEPVQAKYVAPEPCKEPFTRTFVESDVLICPGCKAELGGDGDEAKRKMFISKCSHVYCGACGSGIKDGAKKQGIRCPAGGCGQKITKTKIWEAYI